MLRHRPPNREVGANKNTAVMEGPRVKAKWLEERFSNPFLADVTEVLMQQYARFYILEMLGGMLFMDKSSERVSCICNFSIQSAMERIIIGVVQH